MSTLDLPRVSWVIILALTAIAVAGCGSGPGELPIVERRDSAGIEIVLSHSPAWTSNTRWHLSDTPTVTIGEDMGETPYLLSRVVGGIQLSDGRIVVANGGTNQLRFYDSSGTFIRSVGREGQGPGEFEYLRTIRRCAPNRIFAFDLSWQLSVFDATGELVRSLRLIVPGTTRTPYSLSCGENGRLLLGSWGAETLQRTIGLYRTSASLMLVDSSNAVIHDFGEFRGAERIGSERGSRPHPFGKTLVHALGPTGVNVGTGDAYEIRVFDTDGSLRRMIRWTGPGLAISEADRAAFQESLLARVDPASRSSFERQLNQMPFPDTKPAYTVLRLDPDGNLWVRGFAARGTGEPVWTIFDSTGAMLGELEFPDNFEVFEIGRDYVLGAHRDRLGVIQVQLYSLLKPE